MRRQLAADYQTEDLERTGLVVYSTLDPAVQVAAERALTNGLEALGQNAADFDGAVVITSPQTGEVRALVGGRQHCAWKASIARSTRAGRSAR